MIKKLHLFGTITDAMIVSEYYLKIKYNKDIPILF